MEQIGIWYKNKESADKIFHKLYTLFKNSKKLEKIITENNEYKFCFNNGDWIKVLPITTKQRCIRFTKCYIIDDIDKKDIDTVIRSKMLCSRKDKI